MRRRDVPAALLGGVIALRSRALAAMAATPIWDDCDSHRWIPESWGDAVSGQYRVLEARNAFQISTQAGKAEGWCVIRTGNFPAEEWGGAIRGMKVELWWDGAGALSDNLGSYVSLQPEVRANYDYDRKLYEAQFRIRDAKRWVTCSFDFRQRLTPVGFLSLVLSYARGAAPTFNVGRIALVTDSGDQLWDAMGPSGARNWYYWNNHVAWWHGPFGADPHSRLGGNALTPAASMYLRWDYDTGNDAGRPTAELAVGDETASANALRADWSGYTRITADVRCSVAAAPLSLFLWDANARAGVGTLVQRVASAEHWTSMTWDLVWPPGCDGRNISSLHFVVNELSDFRSGELWLDNIRLTQARDEGVVARNVGLHKQFASFDQGDLSDTSLGAWGEVSPDPSPYVNRHFVDDGGRTVLQMAWQFPSDARNHWGGVWYSLAGAANYPEYALDGGAYRQLRFRVRAPAGRCNLKVELKDNRMPVTERYSHTAYRYVAISDQWQDVALPMDVTDGTFWSYNQAAPDRSRLKEMVFIVEQGFNGDSGQILIDGLTLVDTESAPFDLATSTDEQFLDLVSKKTFRYFTHYTCNEPGSSTQGLILDRSRFADLISVGATGFGLTALTIGAERGWVTRLEAESRVESALRCLWEGPQSGDPRSAMGYRGFYYHFLDHTPDHQGTSGLRKFGQDGVGSELSIIDTALLMAGVLTAAEYFSDNVRIVDLASRLYGRVEWDWFFNSKLNQFYWSFKPEKEDGYEVEARDGGYFTSKRGADGGTVASTVDYYTDEAILISLLAIASPTHPVGPEAFSGWKRKVGTYEGLSLVQSWTGSLFTYVFAHCWLDFRRLGPERSRSADIPGVDWWQNSVRAAQTNRRFCAAQASQYPGYAEGSWGLSACEGPPRRPVGGKVESPYRNYGAPPSGAETVESDGTIAPYGAGSAIVFLPDESIAALKGYFSAGLWDYDNGFIDAWNAAAPDSGTAWYNRLHFGIDQGPMLIMIENHRTSLIWRVFQRNSAIRLAVAKLFGA